MREVALCQERDNLKEQIDYLTKRIFGASSEKGKCDIPGQLNLFNKAETETTEDPVAALPEEALLTREEPEAKPRKKRAVNEECLKGLPVEQVFLDVPEEERNCGVCGTLMETIGTEFVRQELKFIPAKVKAIEYYSVNYGCPKCRKEAVLPQIKKGKDGRAHMIHGMASASTVAWIIANAEDFFTPMYAYFRKKLLAWSFAMADETPVQVLHEPGHRAQTQSYMWLFHSGEDDSPPIILYKYSPTRAGDNAMEFPEGFCGYLIDAVPKGKLLDYTQPSVQGVMYVNCLFELEDKIRQKHAGDYEAIRKARLEKEKPVIDGFLSWLEQQKPTCGSRMAKAVTYIRNREPYLSTYLEDGGCSFSNNLSENAIRPFVVRRKGWLFSDTPAGVETSAVIYTMVENAKAIGVNVYQYLKLLLEKQPNNWMSDEELERFTPWNPEVKALLDSRAADELQNG